MEMSNASYTSQSLEAASVCVVDIYKATLRLSQKGQRTGISSGALAKKAARAALVVSAARVLPFSSYHSHCTTFHHFLM